MWERHPSSMMMGIRQAQVLWQPLFCRESLGSKPGCLPPNGVNLFQDGYMICNDNARSLWQIRHSFLNIRSQRLCHLPSQHQCSAVLKQDCCPLQCIMSTDSIRPFLKTFIFRLYYPGDKMLDDLVEVRRLDWSPIHMGLSIWEHGLSFFYQQPCLHCWLTSDSQRKKRLY